MLKNSEQLNIRFVLGIDPSGNFYEGKGTTGWSVFDKHLNKFIRCGQIMASRFKTQEAYWLAHVFLIRDTYKEFAEQGFAVSFEEFVLYGNRAKDQINSAMETSQLIGIIKLECYTRGIRCYHRKAAMVKKRWADSILISNDYIYKSSSCYFATCHTGVLSEHIRDSMRHAVHCAKFEIKEEKK